MLSSTLRRSTANLRLFHPSLVAIGAGLLIGALVTDLFYWNTMLVQWANFSIWLILGGLIVALLAGIALAADVLLKRLGAISWVNFFLLVAAALLSLLNAFVHSRDAWTSVVPQGLILSAVVTLLVLIVGWHGWSVAAAPPRGDGA